MLVLQRRPGDAVVFNPDSDSPMTLVMDGFVMPAREPVFSLLHDATRKRYVVPMGGTMHLTDQIQVWVKDHPSSCSYVKLSIDAPSDVRILRQELIS